MTRRGYLSFTLSTALIAAAGIPASVAQEFRATITGTVTDATKAVVPNAIISVHNLDTGEVRAFKTNAAGVYVVPFITPAQRIEISVDALGFARQVYPTIKLSVNQTATANFVLQIGSAAQEMTVNDQGYTTGIDTDKPDLGTVIDNKTITQMPLNGRNPLSLMDYIPGVTNEAGPGLETPPNNMYNISFFTVNGTPAQNTEYTIDGMPDNANPWYSNGPSTVPSVDAIQEFKVSTSPYDAQLGRTASGVVSMDLKSGTNKLHGSVYEFAKRGFLDANYWENNYTGLNRPAHTEDQYGFELDGPVYIPKLYDGRSKSFFMFNMERFKEVLPNFQTYDLPNAAWLNGDFTDFTDANGDMMPVFNPFTATTADPTRQIFSNGSQYNSVNPALFNPIAVKMVSMMLAAAPATAQRFPGELPWENLWVDTIPQTSSSQNYIVKFDQIIGEKDHLSGNWIRSYNPSASYDSPVGAPWFDGSTFTEYHMNTGIDEVHTFTSTLLSDVHFSYQRYWRTDGPPAQDIAYNPAQLGFSQGLLSSLPLKTGFPELNFNMQQQSVGTGNGYNNWLAMSRDFYYMPDDSFSLAPTMTWTKHKQNIRFGIDMRDTHLNQTTQWDNIVSYASNGIATSEYWDQNDSNDIAALPNGTPLSQNGSGNAVLDLLLGQPNSVGVVNQVFPYYTWHYYAPWVQDDWKLTPTFTLNLGFRWDLNGPPTARHNWLNTGFDYAAVNPISQAVPGVGTLHGGITFPSTSGTNQPWSKDMSKWQPRLGFAWQPRPTTVLRAGAGRLAMSPTDIPQSYGFQNNPAYSMSPDGGRTYYQNNLGNPYPSGIPAIPGASQGLETYLGEQVAYANPQYKIPSVIDGSAGISQAIANNGKFEMSYVMTRGYGLDTAYYSRDANFALTQSCNALLQTAANPYPQGNCENLENNPFYGVPGFQGAYETSPQLARAYLLNPYPQFSGIEEVQNNWGHTWYNSLQTTYSQHAAWGQIDGTYTWSKTLTSGGYISEPYQIKARSIAGTDRTNRITVTGVIYIPVGRGLHFFPEMNRGLDAALGGWELASDGFWESGQPVALDQNFNIVGNVHSRQPRHNTPDIIDEGVNPCVNIWHEATPTSEGYYGLYTGDGQTAASCAGQVAWASVAPYAPATSQAYTDQFRGPGDEQIDVNLSKNFHLYERLTLQLRMEEFNVLNHPTWFGQVDMTPTDTNFGTVNKILTSGQSNNPRQGQLGAKLIW